MKVIYVNGNLGNQVFVCAFGEYLKKKYPAEKVYCHVVKGCPPVTVEKFFDLKLPPQNLFISILAIIVFYSDILLRKLGLRGWPFVCHSGKLDEKKMFFRNYLQESYYYKNETSSWLRIKIPGALSEDYKNYEKLIVESESVTVHIRRGDYVKPGSTFTDLASTDYYRSAIEKVKELHSNAKFFFFSDDLDYVKAHFKGNDYYYVDCNRGSNSFLDIKLMSLAKVNIMANSTFSYWAAYIGHEQKTVIYPTEWYTNGRPAPAIIINHWIGV